MLTCAMSNYPGPRINGVVESILYVDDLAAAAAFYRDVLGLEPMRTGPDRFVAFRAGVQSVLLLFKRGSTLTPLHVSGGVIPPHDGHGPHHIGFAIAAADYEVWRQRLLAQGVATAVEKLPADKWQGGLVDEGVKLVARAVESSEDAIASTLREQIRASLPRLTPSIAIEAIHRRVMQALERFLAEVTSKPAHPARARVEAALREALDRLREAAEHPGETDGTPSAIAKLLTSVGTHLVADEAARAELEDRLTEMAASLVEEHGAEVASLIEHTVAGWDPDLAAERIELAVGRDLQYIRLNGTLVGGLAGLALYSLSLLF